MELRALGRGDDRGGRAGAVGLGKRDATGRAESARRGFDARERLRVAASREVAVGHRDAEPRDPVAELGPARLGRALAGHRILGIWPVDGVEGGRDVAHRAGERPHVVEAL